MGSELKIKPTIIVRTVPGVFGLDDRANDTTMSGGTEPRLGSVPRPETQATPHKS